MAHAGSGPDPSGPKILVLRGVFEVFSLGMNDLASKLRSRGYDAKSTSWSLALLEAKCSEQRPIVVVGHSLGGRMCGWVPRKLRKCGKRVPLVIIVDANLVQRIPSNVDRCIHLYVTNPFHVFHGSPVRGEAPSTEVINWDVSQGQPSFLQGGVNHFNIDATDWVHQIIIDEIEESFPLAASPVPTGVSPVAHIDLAADPRRESASLSRQVYEEVAARERFEPPGRAVDQAEPQRESTPAAIGWRPARGEAGRERVRQSETEAADEGDGPLLATRPPRIRLPSEWRSSESDMNHRTAKENNLASSTQRSTESLPSKPPRIRIPRAQTDF